jgi:structural maintenance of chromosome 2
MQGRITKVLNMRPPEILAMVEEAASTRMCDQKCTAARQTLAKKERKRADIDQVHHYAMMLAWFIALWN